MRTVTDSKQAFASVEFKKGIHIKRAPLYTENVSLCFLDFFDEFTPPKVLPSDNQINSRNIQGLYLWDILFFPAINLI